VFGEKREGRKSKERKFVVVQTSVRRKTTNKKKISE
jgi:hypothetical protein